MTGRTINKVAIVAVALTAFFLLSPRRADAGSFSISFGIGGGQYGTSGYSTYRSYYSGWGNKHAYQSGHKYQRHGRQLTYPLSHGRSRVVRSTRRLGRSTVIVRPRVYRPSHRRARFWGRRW